MHTNDGAHVNFGESPMTSDAYRLVVVDKANEDDCTTIAGQLCAKLENQEV